MKNFISTYFPSIEFKLSVNFVALLQSEYLELLVGSTSQSDTFFTSTMPTEITSGDSAGTKSPGQIY
jgi:hypothetical protein